MPVKFAPLTLAATVLLVLAKLLGMLAIALSFEPSVYPHAWSLLLAAIGSLTTCIALASVQLYREYRQWLIEDADYLDNPKGV